MASRLRASQLVDMTFKKAAEAYVEAHGESWKNPKHRAQWVSMLETSAYPTIGKLDVQDIGQDQVLAVLEPIWRTKTKTASRLRGRLEAVLDWATVRKHRHGDNPARWKGHLDKLLHAPGKIQKVQHHTALDIDAMWQFMLDLRAREGTSARALEFTILTAARSGEARGAIWSEIDNKQKVWTVPADRMKTGKEHRVTALSSESARANPPGRRQRLCFRGPARADAVRHGPDAGDAPHEGRGCSTRISIDVPGLGRRTHEPFSGGRRTGPCAHDRE